MVAIASDPQKKQQLWVGLPTGCGKSVIITQVANYFCSTIPVLVTSASQFLVSELESYCNRTRADVKSLRYVAMNTLI